MSDWEDLGALWRSNEPPELGDLRRRLRRQSFLIKAWFGHEIALAALAGGFGVWLMLKSDIAAIGAAIAAFAAFALFMSWRAWRGSFDVQTGTPSQAVAAALDRNDALKRYIVANYVISIAAVALVVAMVASDAFGGAGDAARLQRSLTATTIGLGAIAVWLAGCGFYAERLTRERERLVALGRALGVGNG